MVWFDGWYHAFLSTSPVLHPVGADALGACAEQGSGALGASAGGPGAGGAGG
ncbi:hypothetical protein LNP74_06845 [Klebsiella pneumoniae subsp. pneumoniae]|nr:hypothetical protein [Klebsiella pneumoniae subsp. pneumoniae]